MGQEIVKSKKEEFRLRLKEMEPALVEILPTHMKAAHIARVAFQAAVMQPELLQCSTDSVLRGVMQASHLGLELGGALGHAYLIPFKNKFGTMQAQMIPGYRGLLELVRRSGQISTIEARVVYDKDKFNLKFGLEPVLEHEPFLDGEAGKIRFVYAIARFKDGGYQYEVMSLSQIDGIRARSKAKDAGPWVTDYAEMARKTLLKRLIKMLPTSQELRTAIELDTRTDMLGGDATALGLEVPDFKEPVGIIEKPESQSERIKGSLQENGNNDELNLPPPPPLNADKLPPEVLQCRNECQGMLEKLFQHRVDKKNPSTLRTEWVKLVTNGTHNHLAEITNFEKLMELHGILINELGAQQAQKEGTE